MSINTLPISDTVSLDDYVLEDCYRRHQGRVFLTGTQALVTILLLQRRVDDAAGLNTSGFVSGYPGSPLGGVDDAIRGAGKFLEAARINFLPAINEDLAATAILGTQQVEIESSRTVDGVFAMWYGKGCGVDRSGDAIKHGNAYGTSPHGGVLAIAGDDHGCVSSTMSHQSDLAFMSWYMPILNPANISDYLNFGLWGYAASRYSGLWVGFKAISETVESGASVDLPALPVFTTPGDIDLFDGDLNLRYPEFPGMHIEQRAEKKINAIKAFARVNPIDERIFNLPDARFGIVTSGKAYPDVMEALSLLGIDDNNASKTGIDVYKVGMVWPLEDVRARHFMSGKRDILVIEEKRDVIESQLKSIAYNNNRDRPVTIVGKYNEAGQTLVPGVMELSPSLLAPIIATRISAQNPAVDFSASLARLQSSRQTISTPEGVKRTPYFCSGCPHNSSTKIPDGARVLGGTGCHFMTAWMADRQTTDHIMQMGGEGINWLSKSMYINDKHSFQNIGDGTYSHSGLQAIRQAIASDTNITYKILYNDAVAMTGGQQVPGNPTVPQIAAQMKLIGVKKTVVVSDDPARTRAYGNYPADVSIEHRDNLNSVQNRLRDTEGVTALIYDQTCAAEKRRRRKRGTFPDPAKRVFINDLVCEGCGDCSIQSNCLSILPIETEFGRKRTIDQSSCNKDYSCVKGFCPSFVTIEGGELKRSESPEPDPELTNLIANLPDANTAAIENSHNLLVGGIGGTGIMTIGAIISMAAHLERKGVSVQDYTGIAQKGGTVFSYVRIADCPGDLNQIRIDEGAADTVIVCDLVVGNDQRALSVMRNGKTRAIVNTATIPTADFVRNSNIEFQTALLTKTIKDACGAGQVTGLDANNIAIKLLGDTVYSNMLLLGLAWQRGLVPLSAAAIYRAIELNGKSVEKNTMAFDLGRAAGVDLTKIAHAVQLDGKDTTDEQTLPQIIRHRTEFLAKYQNINYANSYKKFVEDNAKKLPDLPGYEVFNKTVARYLFKLMAYKDEYEVARLHTDGYLTEKISALFEGRYKIKFNLAPPILNGALDEQGRAKTMEFGPWMYGAMTLLAKLKFIRGTIFDIFGYTTERRMERKLIQDYRNLINEISDNLTSSNITTAIKIAALPEDIRGYGPIKQKSLADATGKLNQLKKEFAAAGTDTEAV